MEGGYLPGKPGPLPLGETCRPEVKREEAEEAEETADAAGVRVADEVMEREDAVAIGWRKPNSCCEVMVRLREVRSK